MGDDNRLRPGILTIGYGNREMDEFLQLLQDLDVRYLVDVRSVPQSQYRREFSRDSLRCVLAAHGIRYVYMGDCLGGRPSDQSCYVDGRVDYERCRATDAFQAGIARLRKAWTESHRVVLMCSESRPEHCHRAKLIGEELVTHHVPVLHVNQLGTLLSHSEVMGRLTGGQLGLFGPPTAALMSRKRHAQPTAEGSDE